MIIIKEKMQIKISKLKLGGELLVKCNNMYWICKYIHMYSDTQKTRFIRLIQLNKKCCLLLPQCPITFCFLKHYPFVNRYKQTLKPLIKYLIFFFKCIPKLISREGDKFIYISNLNNIALLSIYANFGVFI